MKNDYTKNKAEISNKIRKMKRAFISESHDNYRKPEPETDDKNQRFLFNYFDSDEIELFKKKLFEAASTKEREIRNQTMYREFFDSADWLRPAKKHNLDQRTYEKAHLTLSQKLDEIK